MKHTHKAATLLIAGLALLTAFGCNNSYKTTDSGLHYKFEKSNPGAPQVQEGDVLVGEMTVKLDTIEIFTNRGHADRILRATPSFDGDLYEGLLMMHIGDVATFYIDADDMAKYLEPRQMHPDYKPGTGMKLYYTVNLQDIVSNEDILAEQNNWRNAMEQRRTSEPEAIAAYIKDNHITATPDADGLYIVVKKKGNGPKVQAGSTVAINYTGRLLDGTIFDSSVESDAIQGGLQQSGRTYEPLTHTVGKMSLIPGWERGVMGQPAGTRLQLVVPSALAYGPQGAGELIPPYTPLVFDLEIVSVK